MFLLTVTQPSAPILFGSFAAGMLLMAFIWLLVFAAGITAPKHEAWIGNVFYSTKRAHRIVGLASERIAKGRWLAYVESVWRTFPDHRGTSHFFLIVVDEVKPAKIVPLTKAEAETAIRRLAGDQDAAMLIRDWLDGKNAWL